MKRITLYLICITPFFSNISAETFHFRDGTVVEGEIFWGKDYEPNQKGVILSVNKKLYLHHYPYVKESSCAPPMYYPYYAGKNPPLPLLDRARKNSLHGYSTTIKCTPSRLSFFNFESFTLSDIRKEILYSKMSIMNKANTIKMIDYVMNNNKPNYMTPSFEKTRTWKSHVRIYGNWHFTKGTAIWGESLARNSLKNLKLINKSPSFGTEKTRR